MPLWSNNANTVDAPKWMPVAGSNAHGNVVYGNSSVGAFHKNQAEGIFGANNGTAVSNNLIPAPGWLLMRHGTGPVIGVTVANGSGFVNGETYSVIANVAGDTVTTATGFLTTNATGNLVSANIYNGGAGFANLRSTNAYFNRDQHLVGVTVANIQILSTVTNTTGQYVSKIVVAGTATGFNNTDYFVISNTAGGLVNGIANIVTNATGGSLTFTYTLPGTFTAGQTNAGLIVTALAVNGSASNGTGATFTANLSSGILGYSNTDYILVSNAVVNAKATLVTNSLGGSPVFTVSNVGNFLYTEANNNLVLVAYAANGNQSNGYGAILAGGLINATPVGFSNTDYMVISNAKVNATATFVTNSVGGFVTANVTVNSAGVFLNTLANTSTVVMVYAANGAVSNGSNAAFTGNLTTSTGGYIAVSILDGRSGRVTYEPLVTMHLGNTSATLPGQ